VRSEAGRGGVVKPSVPIPMMRTMPRFLRFLFAFLVALALGVAPLALSGLQPAGAATTSQTPVMGPNLLTAAQLAAWYNSTGHTPDLPTIPGNSVQALAQMFIDEGRSQGVRGDIAFAQSMLESAWLTFPSYGQIRATFNNYAGMYAYNNRRTGTTCADEKKFEPMLPSRCFPTPQAGVLAQIIWLRGYADPTTKGKDLVPRPPDDEIGVAPIWEDFGGQSGQAIWATAIDYGLNVLSVYSSALVFNGARAACLPFAPSVPGQISGSGYWVVTANGSVYSFGTAGYHGGMAGHALAAPITGSEATPSGNGYWELGRDGGIFSFGDAAFHGSTGAMRLNKPVNGMERTTDGKGYWLVADDGGIFSFGDAAFYGSTGAIHLNKPVIGMERTPDGKGYWLVASDGGIFSYGDAKFHGSTGGTHLSQPIVAMQRTPSGNGYWMLRSDGYIYAFGDAKNYGSVGGCGNYHGARSLLVSPDGKGYWIGTNDGSVIPLGDARKLGMPSEITSPPVGLMLQQ
jgi:Mannosyl-glycoprotein endo-beta-N-acetylglucosaminidase